jgi:hypothetical protein
MPIRLTSATDDYDNEQSAQAVGEANQQAASMDYIGQEQASSAAFHRQLEQNAANAERAARQAEADQRKREAAQRDTVARAKKVGIKTEVTPTGDEDIVRHEDNAPVWEHGFQSEPEPGPDGEHAVKYRTPRGQVYTVPTKAIRSRVDPAGNAQYEFDIAGPDGKKQTIQQPVGAKPLWSVDPKTGMRYTGAPDPETGSVGTTPIGIDPVAASEAAIQRQKEANAAAIQERKFQAESLQADQRSKETNLQPLKKTLTDAEKELKDLDNDKIQYRQSDADGLQMVTKMGDLESVTPIETSDPAKVSKAQAWIARKNAVAKTLAETKAAHDPLAAEVFGVEQRRNELAKATLNADHEAELKLQAMQAAHKMGIGVHTPDWQRRYNKMRADPSMTGIFTQAQLDDAGGPLADDVREVALPETTKILRSVLSAQYSRNPTQMVPGAGVRDPSAPMQRPPEPPSLLDHLESGLSAENVAKPGQDARALAFDTLGITDPEKWKIAPVDGPRGELGYHSLIRDGQTIGELSARDNCIVLPKPETEQADDLQQSLINANAKGLPVYFASDKPPLPRTAVRNLITQGEAVGNTVTDPFEREKKLAEIGLSPPAIRQKVMDGQLSVQDGRLLNAAFHGQSDVVTTPATIRQGFQKWLDDKDTGAVNGAQFRNGDNEAKKEVVNRYFDSLNDNANNNIIRPNRGTLATAREEMLKPLAGPNFINSGKSMGSWAWEQGMAMPPLILRGVYTFSGPAIVVGALGGATESDRLSHAQGWQDWDRLTDGNVAHRWKMRPEAKKSLDGLKKWADTANPDDMAPPEVVQQIKDAYAAGLHKLTPDAVAVSNDAWDINKDPTLRAVVKRYLDTSDPNTWSGLHSLLALNPAERQIQKEFIAYNDRPKITAPEDVIKRGKLLNLELDKNRAGELMTMGKALESAKDQKTALNILNRAGGMLKLSPQNAQLALGLLTRTENEDPSSLSSIWRSSLSGSSFDAAVEVVSNAAQLGLGVFFAPETAGASIAAAGASVGARMGAKSLLRGIYSKTLGAVIRAGTERSASFAAAATRINAARAAVGAGVGRAGEAIARAGITTPKFGVPLTIAQKARNVGVTAAKTGVIGMPIESTEEGFTHLASADPNAEGLRDSMMGGAAGSLLLSPIFAGYGGVRQKMQAMRNAKDYEAHKENWAKSVNESFTGKPGFRPVTAADYEMVRAVAQNPQQQVATGDHLAALKELNDATREHAESVAAAQGTEAVPNRDPRLAHLSDEKLAERHALASKLGEQVGHPDREAYASDAQSLADEIENRKNPAIADPPIVPPSGRLLAAQAAVEHTAANLEGVTAMTYSATDELRAIPEAERPLYTAVAKAVSGATDYTAPEAKALTALGGESAIAFRQAESLPADVAGPANVTTLPNAPSVTPSGTGGYRLPPGVRVHVPQNAINALHQRAPVLSGLLGGQHTAAPSNTSAPATVQPAPTATDPYQPISPDLHARMNTPGAQVSDMEKAEVNKKWGAASPYNVPATFVHQSQGGKATGIPTGEKYDSAAPIDENQVLAVTHAAVADEVAARNKAAGRKLVQSSNYQAHDGGAYYNIDEDVAFVNVQRLARSVWHNLTADPKRPKPTRAEVAAEVRLTIDEEVTHAAQIQAARGIYDQAFPDAKAANISDAEKQAAFMAWVADHYGKIWREDLTPEVKAATIKAYGAILESRPEWVRAFEALRMIVQQRKHGVFTEASSRLRQHFEAVLKVLKDWYQGVMDNGKNPRIKAEIEAIEALLKSPPQSAGEINKVENAPPEIKESAPSLNFNVPISKSEQRQAIFSNAESLAAFKFKLDLNIAGDAKSKPDEVAAAQQRANALIAAIQNETGISDGDIEKSLIEYHDAIVQQAKGITARNTLTPPPFHAFSKFKLDASTKALPPPEGGDIISELNREGVRRLGPPTTAPEWDWYNELVKDAGRSKLPTKEARKAARDGDLTDAKAKLFWLQDNVVSTTGGRSIDEAAQDIAGSGEELGRAILAAIDTRIAAKGLHANPAQSAEVDAKAQTQNFATLVNAGTTTGRQMTGAQIVAALDPDATSNEVKIGDEWFDVNSHDENGIHVTASGKNAHLYGNQTLVLDQSYPVTEVDGVKIEPVSTPGADDPFSAPSRLNSAPSEVVKGSLDAILSHDLTTPDFHLAEPGKIIAAARELGRGETFLLPRRQPPPANPAGLYAADLGRHAQEPRASDQYGAQVAAGGEHQVYLRDGDSHVTKQTLAGFYGYVPVEDVAVDTSGAIKLLQLRLATPAEYLHRLGLFSQTFNSPIGMVGVESLAEGPSIVTQQPLIIGTKPDQKAIGEYMKGLGFEELPDVDRTFRDPNLEGITYYRVKDKLLVTDARPENFRIDSNGELKPLDLMMSVYDLDAKSLQDSALMSAPARGYRTPFNMLAGTAATMKAMQKPAAQIAPQQEAPAPQPSPRSILDAYRASLSGKSGDIVPIKAVFDAAHAADPSLKISDFLQAIGRMDDGRALFIPADDLRIYNAAKPFVHGAAANAMAFQPELVQASTILHNLDKVKEKRTLLPPEQAAYVKALGMIEPAPAHPPVTHVMPDGYQLTAQGMQTLNSSPVRAYHGTPHKVDEFSLDKIGTGEGVQAFGWGLYFAKNDKVAKEYQDKLGRKTTYDGKPYDNSDPRHVAASMAASNGVNEAITRAEALLSVDRSGPRGKLLRGVIQELKGDSYAARVETNSGNLYTVDLLPDEEDFLDWDKPLSEQSEKVKAALLASGLWTERNMSKATGNPLHSGSFIYETHGAAASPNSIGTDGKAASKALLDLGIPGIRYLDGNSRDGGSGTSNYVLFDDKLVKIIAENGKPVNAGESLNSAPSMEAPTFYSKLERVIEEKMPVRADAKAVKGMIGNQSSGVKAEEIKWSGILPWLDSKSGLIAKSDVLDYLRGEGAVRFEERTLGGDSLTDEEDERWMELQLKLNNDEGLTADERREYNALDKRSGTDNAVPKYSEYQLPGGENYREVVLVMPEPVRPMALPPGWSIHRLTDDDTGEPINKLGVFDADDTLKYYGERPSDHASEEAAKRRTLEVWSKVNKDQIQRQRDNSYTSSHFSDIPNYVAHMRLNDRTDAAGQPGTFIEEIQSDRHQAGREKGYREDRVEIAAKPGMVAQVPWGEYTPSAAAQWIKDSGSPELYTTTPVDSNTTDAIPDAPYRTSWPIQMFKRALVDAVATGKAWIGWTTGQTQADRYDMSKQVDAIRYLKTGDTFTISAEKDGTSLVEKEDLTPSQVADYVGKEIAQKIINGEGESSEDEDHPEVKILSGVALKVGGEGMKGFYDTILPKEVSKYVKQWGAGVKNEEIATSPDNQWDILDDNGGLITSFPTKEGAETWAARRSGRNVKRNKMAFANIWRVDITPEMAASVEAGQALFSSPADPAQVREILDLMPKPWVEILQAHQAGQSIDEIAKARNISPELAAHSLHNAQGRFNWLSANFNPLAKVRAVDGGVKAVGGRPDLAYGAQPAFTAVDQQRNTPEIVTHAEMQDAAARMFATDPTAAEKLVTRWMDSGTTDLRTDDMPDAIKNIVADAQNRNSSLALMTAASQLLATESAFNGGSSAKIARLIDLYRSTGNEVSRAMSQRRDPFDTPAERNAWFLQNVLLTPPQSLRNQIAKNPANKAQILAEWAKKADKIKDQMRADGIDLDATFAQMKKERELAAATIPEPVKAPLAQAAKKTRQLVSAILEGKTRNEALAAAGMKVSVARAAFNGFRDSLNKLASKAASFIGGNNLQSSPGEVDYATQLGLPEWTEHTDLNAAPVRNSKTQALAIQRNRKMTQGELDLTNPLSVNKARKAAESRKASGFDKMSEFWRASILSGPQTGIANVVSGLTYGTYEATFKKMATATLADIARMFGMKPDAASWKDLPAMVAAVFPSVQQAGRDMIRAWNTESGVFDSYALQLTGESGELWKEGHTSALTGWTKKIMHAISFRHMGAADEFVKSFFTRIEVCAQARQVARNERLEGKAMADRIAELMEPGSLAWERALASAKRITFQDQKVFGHGKLESPLQPGHRAIDVMDKVAEIIQRTKNGSHGRALKGLAHFTFPFVSTPNNVFKEAVTMSPVGGVLAIIDGVRSLQRMKQGNVEEAKRIYNAARALDDFTNQIVAWGFILGLSSLIKPGDDDDQQPYVTGTNGTGATNTGERELAYRTAPPMSIRIGGGWYSYKKLDPLATAFASIVDSIRQFQSGAPLDESSAKVVVGMLKIMKDKTMMQGISDLVNAISDPGRFAIKWASSIAIGFVPNALRAPMRAGDDFVRDTDQPNDMPFVTAMARRLGYGMAPIASNPLTPMPAVSVFGQPVSKDTGTGQPGSDMLLRLLSPVERHDNTKPDPLEVKLMAYNMSHDESFGIVAPSREITRTLNGKKVKVSLDDAEDFEFTTRSGKAFRAALEPFAQKKGPLTDDDVKEIKTIHERVMGPFRDDAFMRALARRQADGRVKL